MFGDELISQQMQLTERKQKKDTRDRIKEYDIATSHRSRISTVDGTVKANLNKTEDNISRF